MVEEVKKEVQEVEKKPDNVIFISDKPIRNYYYGPIMAQFEEKNSSEVFLRARGRNILNAINLANFSQRISKGKFTILNVTISEDLFKDKKNNTDREFFVNEIDIKLVKKG